MAKHSSGEWSFRGKERMAVFTRDVDGRLYKIADVRPVSNPERTIANARLLAAAPRLLAACEAARRCLQDLRLARVCEDLETEAELVASIRFAEGS